MTLTKGSRKNKFDKSVARPEERRAWRAGFSLVEAIITLAILGILLAMAVPSYERTLEQARADIAAANLRAVWAAERLYWLDERTYTTDLTAIQARGLLDPQIVRGSAGYVFAIASADASTFTAPATRAGSPHWSGQFSIDDTGLVTGAVQSPGGPSLVPGFQ